MLPRVPTKDGDREARIGAYSSLHKVDLDAWLAHFLAHQDGEIDWEAGMVFRNVQSLNLDSTKSKLICREYLLTLTNL